MGIRILSRNVEGFNSPQKRKNAFRAYRHLGADILLLQETHFSDSNHPSIFDRQYKQHFYTTFNSTSKGVAIFIKNSVLLEVQHVYKDPSSRFLIIQGSICGKAIKIANVYAPNVSQASFFASFFQVLDRYIFPHLVLGGDFNLVAHLGLDRSRVVSNANAFPKTLIHLLSSHQLIDSWWAHNVGARDYTFYSHSHDSYSRLDNIFSTPVLLANSTAANIHPCPWSDHHMVMLSIAHIGISPVNATWRLNDSLLSDPDLVAKVTDRLDEYFHTNNTRDTLPTMLMGGP